MFYTNNIENIYVLLVLPNYFNEKKPNLYNTMEDIK